MKYKVYEHLEGHRLAVKQGFLWPAFIFYPLWLGCKGQYIGLGIMLALNVLIAHALFNSYSVGEIDTGRAWQIFVALQVFISAAVGYVASELETFDYKYDDDYTYIGEAEANSPGHAIERLNKRG